MAGGLMQERVRRDVEVLARAGLDTATFVAEVDESLRRAVPNVASCFATLDPATHLLTGTYKFGALEANNDRDQQWAEHEYGADDPTTFAALATSEVPAVGLHQATAGDLHACERFRELLEPAYGFSDELRVTGRSDGRGWGGIALFRAHDDGPFAPADVAYVAELSASFAAGLRAGLLAHIAAGALAPSGGPVVLVVDAGDTVARVSVGAEAVLGALAGGESMSPATGVIAGLVAAARRYAAGETQVLPRTRVRLTDGRWIVAHASPLTGASGPVGEVVVTIEEARPPEIVPLVVSAFGLTARERDVTQLVLQGVDTKDIAATLHMSRYTVQDHLKSVFEKAGVRSRRELTSRVFFDQYVPHMNGDLAPSGWYSCAVT